MNIKIEKNYWLYRDSKNSKKLSNHKEVAHQKERRKFLILIFKFTLALFFSHQHISPSLVSSIKSACLKLKLLVKDSASPIRSDLASIHVDWSKALYDINFQAFGLNGFKATNPNETANHQYIERLKYMLGNRHGGGMFRIHTWEMMGNGENGWISFNGTWDSRKIQRSIKNLVDAGFNLCINIPDGNKPENKVNDPKAFAEFCASLVQIINIDGALGVTYWEIPNERDEERTGEQLAEIFNTAASTMKAVDPSIKVGGPAYQYPSRANEVRSFIDLTLDNLDFLSFHNYAGGGGMTDEEVWDAAGAEYYITFIRAYLDKASPKRRIPLWYDEFNIGWSWELAQEQQNGICGAIYDALTLAKSLDYGADVLCAWNEKDGSYGKIDDDFNFRPAAHVFYMFNSAVYGHRVETTSDSTAIVTFASKSNDGRHSLLLINRSKSSQAVRVLSSNQKPEKDFLVSQVTSLGYEERNAVPQKQLSNGINLPSESVTALTCIDNN